jgi:hypothetical protein
MGAGPAGGMPSVGNAIHAISIHDVASDTVHQFAPTYRDYVLYSDSNNPEEVKEQPKTFRAKTFVAIGAVRCPTHVAATTASVCLSVVSMQRHPCGVILFTEARNCEPSCCSFAHDTALHDNVLLLVQKKAQDGLLQNMEMGNSAAWYNQDSAAEGASPPAADQMVRNGLEPDVSKYAEPASSPKSATAKLANGKASEPSVRIVAKSENPDLSYINSDALAARAQPADPPPPVQRPNRDAPQPGAPGAWADVGLDD